MLLEGKTRADPIKKVVHHYTSVNPEKVIAMSYGEVSETTNTLQKNKNYEAYFTRRGCAIARATFVKRSTKNSNLQTHAWEESPYDHIVIITEEYMLLIGYLCDIEVCIIRSAEK